MKLKVIATEADAWEACLALWKRLSEIPSGKSHSSTTGFKNAVLHDLGYEECAYGCPFCEFFGDFSSCGECPLHMKFYGCYNTTYAYWHDNFDKDGHSQQFARVFYEFLCTLKEKIEERKRE